MKARELRASGESVKAIAATLRVSTSSVSRWVRDIELTSEQMKALQERNPIVNRQLSGTRAMAARHLERRCEAQRAGRRRARARDPVYIGACMLYWAEGAKDRNTLSFTNSDPAMMAFFVRFLRTHFAVPDRGIRVRCHLFVADAVERERIEQEWLDVLGLPRSCLSPSMVNRYSRSSRKKRRGMLPLGTCQIRVHDTRLVQTLFGSIQEFAAFDRPEWLGR